MNLYLIVTEEIQYPAEVIDYDVRYEWAPAVELVVARNRSQARYILLRDHVDIGNHYTLVDAPKMSIRLQAKDVEGQPRIASKEHPYDDPAWGASKEQP